MARETITASGIQAEFQDDLKVAGEIYNFGNNGSFLRIGKFTQEITLTGASTALTVKPPAGALVFAVDTKVTTAITGASGYQVGDGSDADKWGDKTGTAVTVSTGPADYTAGGLTSYTTALTVTLTAKTSNFTAGKVRVVGWYLFTQQPQS